MKAFVKVFVLVFFIVSSSLFSMEKEEPSKKAKIEAEKFALQPMEVESAIEKSTTLISCPFLPEFDIDQPVIILGNLTGVFDFQVWVKNNYFDLDDDFFIVDKIYTTNPEEYIIPKSEHSGPSIKLPKQFLNTNINAFHPHFAIIPINQIEESISIIIEKSETESFQFIISKKLLQNKDRSYSSIYIYIEPFFEIAETFVPILNVQNSHIKNNFRKLITYKIDKTNEYPYQYPLKVSVYKKLFDHILSIHKSPRSKIIYLISQSEEQKRMLSKLRIQRQEKEIPRLLKYIERNPPSPKGLIEYKRK
jgi:hypothetical protein